MPNAVPLSSIGITPFSTHIDMTWPAATDGYGGWGIWEYQILRNGLLVGTNDGLVFLRYHGCARRCLHVSAQSHQLYAQLPGHDLYRAGSGAIRESTLSLSYARGSQGWRAHHWRLLGSDG
jgi:hypothetical protein